MCDDYSLAQTFYNEHGDELDYLFTSYKKTKKYKCIGSPKKNPVYLRHSTSGIEFRQRYQNYFPGIRSDLIRNYHILICEKNDKIPKACRDDFRNIGIYFDLMAEYESAIFIAIKELEKEGKINYQRDKNDQTCNLN